MRPRLEVVLLHHALDDVVRLRVEPVKLKTDRLLFANQLTLDRPLLVHPLHRELFRRQFMLLNDRIAGRRGRLTYLF